MTIGYKRFLVAALLATSSLGVAEDEKPQALISGRADPSLHLQGGSTQTEAQKVNAIKPRWLDCYAMVRIMANRFLDFKK